MYASMWSYPWDLVECGMEAALDDMQSNGLTGVSMITSYHAGRFLCIRNPKRKIYFPEDGVLYYNTDLSRFQGLRIQPKVGQFAKDHPDFWEKLFAETRKRGMTVSGWTVCLHNTRIGMEYPDACVQNAYGDVVYYNQCPSNPDVRAYMAALVDDLCSHLPLHSLELESMNYMGHAHEYHHEKDGIGLTALQDFLLSLCFCPSCVARAKAEGLDILPAQATVRRWLDEMCMGELLGSDADFMRLGLEFFKPWPEVYAYLQWRSTVVTSLMQEVHEAVAGRCRLYFLSLLTHSRSWLFGVDLKAITRYCEGVVVCSYDCDEHQAKADLAECRRDFAPGSDLLIGMRCFHPEYTDGAAFARKVAVAKQQPVDGYLFYNYGLIPPKQLRWVWDALQGEV